MKYFVVIDGSAVLKRPDLSELNWSMSESFWRAVQRSDMDWWRSAISTAEKETLVGFYYTFVGKKFCYQKKYLLFVCISFL